jgi:hypothetical protein
MKQPNVKECPCCGGNLFPKRDRDGLPPLPRYLPICKQWDAVTASGTVSHYELHWKCCVCGCTWLHREQQA